MSIYLSGWLLAGVLFGHIIVENIIKKEAKTSFEQNDFFKELEVGDCFIEDKKDIWQVYTFQVYTKGRYSLIADSYKYLVYEKVYEEGDTYVFTEISEESEGASEIMAGSFKKITCPKGGSNE